MSARAERFFLWLWRINGLLFFVVGVAGAAGAGAILFNVLWSPTRPERNQPLTRVGDTDVAADQLRLADFRTIAGTDFLYAELGKESDFGKFGSGGGRGATHNLLFFHTSNKDAHWLLSGNRQTIPSFHFLMDPPSDRYPYDDGPPTTRDQVALALLAEIEPPDERAGSRRLAIASAEGRGLEIVADPIDHLLGYHQLGATSVLVFYVVNGTVKVLDIDPRSRRVRSDETLSTSE
jgi:hypothetical protein